MLPSNLVISPLRISTMVVTGHIGTTLSLQKLLDIFHEKAIPLSWPGEGFLKVEYKPIFTVAKDVTSKARAKAVDKLVIGTCSRDELTNRKKSKNIFFNQSPLVL